MARALWPDGSLGFFPSDYCNQRCTRRYFIAFPATGWKLLCRHKYVLQYTLWFGTIANHTIDENRKRVVDRNYTLPIIELFQNPAVMHVAVPVIYNICVDFGRCSSPMIVLGSLWSNADFAAEPAQAQVAANGICYSLLELLAGGSITGNALLTYTYELVEMASEQGLSPALCHG